MRYELSKAIDKLPAVGSVAVIFFSGPTWVAGKMPKLSMANGRGITARMDGNRLTDTTQASQMASRYAVQQEETHQSRL